MWRRGRRPCPHLSPSGGWIPAARYSHAVAAPLVLQSCRQGRHAAAAAILERDLPPGSREWYAASGLPAAAAKERLGRLFNEEQARVESHWIRARVGAAPAPASAPASPPYPGMQFAPIGPRRIPVDDVTDMIDAARELSRC